MRRESDPVLGGGRSTRLVHGGENPGAYEGAVVLPVFHSAMYEERRRVDDQVQYIRYDNTPNQRALAQKLALVEGAEDAVVLGSGMAAISSALLSVLRAGDHLLAQDCLYGGTFDLLTKDLPELGIEVEFVASDDVADFESRRRDTTRAVYLETLTNPLLHVTDLDGIARWARSRGLVSLIDNTMATPLNFRPHEHGFDLSIHSATKFLNGHSDLVAGVVLGSPDRVRAVRRKAQRLGGSLDPGACSLLLRGVKTLEVRLERAQRTALALARWLTERDDVERVHHPGLATHASYARAQRLLDGAGGLLAFDVASGERAQRVQDALRLFTAAPSFGGVESLITRPANTSHHGLGPAERARRGIADGLLRVSVGLEDFEDLRDDLEQALDRAGEH